MRRFLHAIALLVLTAATSLTAAPATQPVGTAWNRPPKTTPGGVEHHTFVSKSMNVEVGYNIYLPPDYKTAAEKRYPVVYFLHGRGGNESNNLFLFDLFDKAIKAGDIPPMIYVHANGEANSGYVDSVDGKIMSDTAIIKELIPHIDATYRTIATKEGRAMEGFSMGGQGALLFAFKYPELFSSAIGYAAGLASGAELKKELPKVFKAMHNDDIEQFDATSAWAYARKNAENIRGHIALKLALGGKDIHLDRNHRMSALLKELKIEHEYLELPGIEHNTGKVMKQIAVDGWKFEAAHFGAVGGKT